MTTTNQPPAVPLDAQERAREILQRHYDRLSRQILVEDAPLLDAIAAALTTTPAAAQPVECQGCIAAHEGYRIYNHLHTCKESDKARERITRAVIEWERDLGRKGMKPEHLDLLVDRIAALTTTPATSEAPSVYAAISEVERLRDKWNSRAEQAEYPSHLRTLFNGKTDAANEIIESLRALPPDARAVDGDAREVAQEIVRAWLLTSNPHHLIKYKEQLIDRIAAAITATNKGVDQ